MTHNTLRLLGFLIWSCGNPATQETSTLDAEILSDSSVSNIQPTISNNYPKCISSFDNKIYQCLPDSQTPEHLFSLIFKCKDDTLTAIMLGPAPEGEHGLFYFRSNLENLKIDSAGTIEFNCNQGYIYPKAFNLKNYNDSINTEDAGISNDIMFFKGHISNNNLTLNCKSEFDVCYDKTLIFVEKVEE